MSFDQSQRIRLIDDCLAQGVTGCEKMLQAMIKPLTISVCASKPSMQHALHAHDMIKVIDRIENSDLSECFRKHTNEKYIHILKTPIDYGYSHILQTRSGITLKDNDFITSSELRLIASVVLDRCREQIDDMETLIHVNDLLVE